MEKQDPSNTENRSSDFSEGVQAVAAATKNPVDKESYESKKGFEKSARRKKVKAVDKLEQADTAEASGNTRKADRKRRAAVRKTKKANKLEKSAGKKADYVKRKEAEKKMTKEEYKASRLKRSAARKAKKK